MKIIIFNNIQAMISKNDNNNNNNNIKIFYFYKV